jgi:hypothetical protein
MIVSTAPINIEFISTTPLAHNPQIVLLGHWQSEKSRCCERRLGDPFA